MMIAKNLYHHTTYFTIFLFSCENSVVTSHQGEVIYYFIDLGWTQIHIYLLHYSVTTIDCRSQQFNPSGMGEQGNHRET